MANMSYCRFQNTLLDLQACFDHIGDNDLSPEERQARRQLVDLCRVIYEETESQEQAIDKAYFESIGNSEHQ